jgi:hypothetical protein
VAVPTQGLFDRHGMTDPYKAHRHNSGHSLRLDCKLNRYSSFKNYVRQQLDHYFWQTSELRRRKRHPVETQKSPGPETAMLD